MTEQSDTTSVYNQQTVSVECVLMQWITVQLQQPSTYWY